MVGYLGRKRQVGQEVTLVDVFKFRMVFNLIRVVEIFFLNKVIFSGFGGQNAGYFLGDIIFFIIIFMTLVLVLVIVLVIYCRMINYFS